MIGKPPGATRSDGYPDSQLSSFAADPQRELAEPAADDEAAQICTAAQGGAYLIEYRIDDAVIRPWHSQPRPAQIAPYAGGGQPVTQPPPWRAVVNERPPVPITARNCSGVGNRAKRYGRAERTIATRSPPCARADPVPWRTSRHDRRTPAGRRFPGEAGTSGHPRSPPAPPPPGQPLAGQDERIRVGAEQVLGHNLVQVGQHHGSRNLPGQQESPDGRMPVVFLGTRGGTHWRSRAAPT